MGNQLGRVVGRKLVEKEEIRGGDGIPQQLDALANERRDGQQLFRRRVQAGLLKKRLQYSG